MKTLFIFIFFCFINNGFTQKLCLIAVNSNDCASCQVSYNFINKVDRKLNPIIVLSKTDSITAHYFIREYLKITDIDYTIDDIKYQSLIKDKFSLQIQLFEDSKLIFQFPVKDLSFRINDLNNFSRQKTSIDQSNQKLNKDLNLLDFKLINETIKKRFIGSTKHFIVNDELILFNELTRWIICTNLNSNKSINIRLEDSLLYDILRINTDTNKRKFYKSNIENLAETQITSYCYYGNKLYLAYSAINYLKMKNEIEIATSNNVAELEFKEYLVKFDISNGNLKLEKKLDLSEQYNSYSVRYGFSIFEDKPVLYIKKEASPNDSFYYIPISENWTKINSVQARPDLMSNYLLEQVFYNNLTYNYDNFTLINNTTGKYKKLFQGTMLSTFLLTGGSLYINKNSLYIDALKRETHKLLIYKISLDSGGVTLIESLEEQNMYDFYPIFYLDKNTNKILTLDIDDNKELIIVNKISI